MGVPASTVKLDAKIDSMGLDSLDVVELTQAVKKQLMIPVKPKDFENAATLQDAVDIIREKAQEKPERAASGAQTNRSARSFKKETRVFIPLA